MTRPPIQLYLASASPRRQALLRQIGIHFTVIDGEVEESVMPEESAESYVRRIALAKAQRGWELLPVAQRTAPVLGADTEVVIETDVLGKPRDAAHASAMLARLSGRTHRVLSAVAVVDDAQQQVIVQENLVTMRAISTHECAAYWASGEPQGKAGGYAVQGLGAVFIERLVGSYSGVMGLPLFETAKLLQAFGIDLWPKDMPT
ncbi:MAG: Maf family nucleotide pyrophosphatase [Gammaproteobacteria bacterium]|nr:Maf family nucleotide pyrophosphatase [Gammaproteobacteria bacterium]